MPRLYEGQIDYVIPWGLSYPESHQELHARPRSDGQLASGIQMALCYISHLIAISGRSLSE